MSSGTADSAQQSPVSKKNKLKTNKQINKQIDKSKKRVDQVLSTALDAVST